MDYSIITYQIIGKTLSPLLFSENLFSLKDMLALQPGFRITKSDLNDKAILQSQTIFEI